LFRNLSPSAPRKIVDFSGNPPDSLIKGRGSVGKRGAKPLFYFIFPPFSRRVKGRQSPYNYGASRRDEVPLKNYFPFPLVGEGDKGDRVTSKI
jgi:hypothetical protein